MTSTYIAIRLCNWQIYSAHISLCLSSLHHREYLGDKIIKIWLRVCVYESLIKHGRNCSYGGHNVVISTVICEILKVISLK